MSGEMGLGARPRARDAVVLSLGLLVTPSPPLPQEEETLSFIRDSLEKSDQLTKNMVSNRQLRGADGPREPGRSLAAWRLQRLSLRPWPGWRWRGCMGVS